MRCFAPTWKNILLEAVVKAYFDLQICSQLNMAYAKLGFMKFSLLALSLIFHCAYFTQEVFACSCFALPPIYQAYETTDAVFVGKVTGSNEPKVREDSSDEDVFFDIEVLESFKGVESKSVKLNRGSIGSSCYSGYQIGETYLFYASKKPDGGFFVDRIKGENIVYQGSFCHHTENLKSAQDQLIFIREMLQGKPESQIYGSVARSDLDPVYFEWQRTYLGEIKVVLIGDKNTFETVTDKNGIFRFNNIPEGKYVIKPSPGIDYKVYFPESETFQVLQNRTILPERGDYFSYKSFYADFSLGWNNRIEGYAIDSEGNSFERFVIKMLPISKAEGEMFPDYLKNSPDPHTDGFFFFGGITPGKYVLALEVYTPSSNGVKKRFYYPNSETVAKAQIFEINSTSKIQNLNFRVPLTIRDVKGEVVWSDGTSVGSRGWLVLKNSETNNGNVSFDWESTKNGKFVIQAFEGFEYWIHPKVTYFDTDGGFSEKLAKPIKIKISKDMKDIRIIIEKPANFKCEKINDCS